MNYIESNLEKQRRFYDAEHHKQVNSANFYAYSNGQSTLLANSVAYVYLENNTDRDMIIYPGQVTCITTSSSTDVNFKIERYENSVVDKTLLNKLNSKNLGNLSDVPNSFDPVTQKTKGLDVYFPQLANITLEGDIINSLSSFVIGANAANEEERGERYILKKGENMLAKITNNVAKDLNIHVRSYWSYL